VGRPQPSKLYPQKWPLNADELTFNLRTGQCKWTHDPERNPECFSYHPAKVCSHTKKRHIDTRDQFRKSGHLGPRHSMTHPPAKPIWKKSMGSRRATSSAPSLAFMERGHIIKHCTRPVATLPSLIFLHWKSWMQLQLAITYLKSAPASCHIYEKMCSLHPNTNHTLCLTSMYSSSFGNSIHASAKNLVIARPRATGWVGKGLCLKSQPWPFLAEACEPESENFSINRLTIDNPSTSFYY